MEAPHTCPNCGFRLDTPGGPPPAKPVSICVNGIPDEPAPVDLFATKPVVPVDPSLVASGDIYVPESQLSSLPAPEKLEEPEVVGTFELVASGQARPAKQAQHVIPGRTRTDVQPVTTVERPVRSPPRDNFAILDDPSIGGRVTICVLCYGSYHHLHRRCLDSICSTVPAERMDLRVGGNELCPETLEYLKTLPITKTYLSQSNRLKYPVMREIFHDKDDPIRTKWVVWFDDDSYARKPDWLPILAMTIAAQRGMDRLGAVGSVMLHPVQKGKDPRPWLSKGSWWRNRPLRDRRGRETPNGPYFIHFPVGGFFAISLEAIKACDIPDPRLTHAGDIVIGAQLDQNRFLTKQFNTKKEICHTSAAPPRGASVYPKGKLGSLPFYV